VFGRRAGDKLGALLGRFAPGRPDAPPPSHADPSSIVHGETIATEDDALHIRTLPVLAPGLTEEDTEVLVQYLTAPYVRVPLILGFFADAGKIAALAHSDVQDIVNAAVFEPGPHRSEVDGPCGKYILFLVCIFYWLNFVFFFLAMIKLSTDDKTPQTAPCDPAILGTPAGALFNELVHSPTVVLNAVRALVVLAVELDTGRCTGPDADAVLFAARLAARVRAYAAFLERHVAAASGDGCDGGGDGDGDGDGGGGDGGGDCVDGSATPRGIAQSSGRPWLTPVRGLLESPTSLGDLRRGLAALDRAVQREMVPLLARWRTAAAVDRDVFSACRASLHAAVLASASGCLQANAVASDEAHAAAETVLGAQLFATAHHRFGEASSGTGVSRVALAWTYHGARHRIAGLVDGSEGGGSLAGHALLSRVVASLTLSGAGTGGARDSSDHWLELPGEHGEGRYVVDADFPKHRVRGAGRCSGWGFFFLIFLIFFFFFVSANFFFFKKSDPFSPIPQPRTGRRRWRSDVVCCMAAAGTRRWDGRRGGSAGGRLRRGPRRRACPGR
jgi:hypothetical protein